MQKVDDEDAEYDVKLNKENKPIITQRSYSKDKTLLAKV